MINRITPIHVFVTTQEKDHQVHYLLKVTNADLTQLGDISQDQILHRFGNPDGAVWLRGVGRRRKKKAVKGRSGEVRLRREQHRTT